MPAATPTPYRVEIPWRFRDKWFSEEFANSIQKPIRELPVSIEIDFSNCGWADPIPLLALLCELWKWRDGLVRLGKVASLTIELGRVTTIQKDGDSTSRVRLYLAKHGFLQAIAETCTEAIFSYESSVDGQPTDFGSGQLDNLVKLIAITSPDKLYYADAPVCRPLCLEIPALRDPPGRVVEQFVDRIVQSMDDEFFRGRSTKFSYRDSALTRLREVAAELVANSWEHAYPADESGAVFVYARIRNPSDRRRVIESSEQCPLISIIHEVTADWYVEFFLCDTGRGLVADADVWMDHSTDAETIQEFSTITSTFGRSRSNWPFRKLAQMVFRRPVSRHARQATTGSATRSNITGLLHVNNVLSRQNDRSRIVVGKEWLAGPHPREADFFGGPGQASFLAIEPSTNEGPPLGTFFHFALEVSGRRTELDENWLRTAQPFGTDFVTIAAAFQAEVETATLPAVFDIRSMIDSSGSAGDGSAISNDAIIKLARPYFEHASISICRVSRHFPKGLSDPLVGAWAHAALASTGATTLTFCDLSRMRAILLRDHLKQLKFYQQPSPAGPIVNATVLIVSEELDACILSLRVSMGEAVEPLRQFSQLSFIDCPNGPPRPDQLQLVLRALRAHDSNLYWDRVSKIGTEVSLLKRDVLWARAGTQGNTESVSLPIYLDYGLASQDRVLAKIVRRSLRRAIAAFPGLNAIPIDDLVAPDLADAQRWSEPTEQGSMAQSELLFVLSCMVTGSMARHAEQRFGPALHILSTFVVETNPAIKHATPVFSALEWRPLVTVARGDESELKWERIPGTPFINRTGAYRPIVRVQYHDQSQRNLRPTPEESYRDWQRGRLMRVGHWIIDRRHALIEIDHARALQQSAESGKGFYSWLAAELIERSGGHPNPLIVYPAGRLGAILIRHLLHKQPDFAAQSNTWRAFPLSFLPDIGDGFRRIAPLTLEQIGETIRARGIGPTFFIDIGFVGNRTFRHAKRQLAVLGIRKLVGLGILNRTSFPFLPSEMGEAEDIVSYWRVDVPTLNDERSCPLCRSIVALAALRERIQRFQPALTTTIDEIDHDWAPRDPNLSWRDHGLEPVRLTKVLRKRFGFVPKRSDPSEAAPVDTQGQAALIDQRGSAVQALGPDPDEFTEDSFDWRYVWLETSTHAATYATEIARATSSSDYPWKLAGELGADNPIAAIEIVATFLLLCTGDLSVASKHRGAKQLVQHLISLENSTSSIDDTEGINHLRRLRGLATLTLINLDAATKRLLIADVVDVMCLARVIKPETRVAIMAAVMPTSAAINSNYVQFTKAAEKRLAELKESEKSNSSAAAILDWNYLLVTSNEVSIEKQFIDAVRFFGQRNTHGDLTDIIARADEASLTAEDQSHLSGVEPDSTAGWDLIRSCLQRAHAIVCQGRDSAAERSVSVRGVGQLFRSLCQISSSDVDALCHLSDTPTPRNGAIVDAIDLLQKIAGSFHSSLLRFESGTTNSTFSMLRGRLEGLISRSASDIRLSVNIDATSIKLEGFGYLLFPLELEKYIANLIVDAAKYSRLDPVAVPGAFKTSTRKAARVWVRLILGKQKKAPILQFWNIGGKNSDSEAFKRKSDEVMPFLRSMGGGVFANCPIEGSNTWFVTSIRIPIIRSGTV